MVRIPQFSSDEGAFEWHESHEVSDHLEDTEEVKPDTIIYEQVRIIREALPKQVFIYYDEQILVDDQPIIIREGESATTWTSSLPSYVTTQK